jgi:hypothetical protein
VNTCQFHRNRKAVAALTNTVHLCEHCLRLAMPMLEARRNIRVHSERCVHLPGRMCRIRSHSAALDAAPSQDNRLLADDGRSHGRNGVENAPRKKSHNAPSHAA